MFYPVKKKMPLTAVHLQEMDMCTVTVVVVLGLDSLQLIATGLQDIMVLVKKRFYKIMLKSIEEICFSSILLLL